MKLNLRNFEENLIARDEGVPIQYVSHEKCVYDCPIEPGDTVALHARQDLEDVMLIGNDLLVRVESVDGDVREAKNGWEYLHGKMCRKCSRHLLKRIKELKAEIASLQAQLAQEGGDVQ